MSSEISAIPTVYGGVQLKSRMESKVALLLDKLGWSWEYEPFSVMLDGINYTPDFYIRDRQYVIECRGYRTERSDFQIERFRQSVISESFTIPNFPIKDYAVVGDGLNRSIHRHPEQDLDLEALIVYFCPSRMGWFLSGDACCNSSPVCYQGLNGFRPSFPMEWIREIGSRQGEVTVSQLWRAAFDCEQWATWAWSGQELYLLLTGQYMTVAQNILRADVFTFWSGISAGDLERCEQRGYTWNGSRYQLRPPDDRVSKRLIDRALSFLGFSVEGFWKEDS